METVVLFLALFVEGKDNMKYKVIATYVFEVEADSPEWAQELIDVNCIGNVYNIHGKAIYPDYEVEKVSEDE